MSETTGKLTDERLRHFIDGGVSKHVEVVDMARELLAHRAAAAADAKPVAEPKCQHGNPEALCGKCAEDDGFGPFADGHAAPPSPAVPQAAQAVLDWYDRDGSVGGASEAIEALRDAVTPPSPAVADDPKMDGTDAAHPAWWRGHDNGVIGAVASVARVLDTGEVTGTCGEPLQSLRARVANLVRPAVADGELAELRRKADAVAEFWEAVECGQFDRGITFHEEDGDRVAVEVVAFAKAVSSDGAAALSAYIAAADPTTVRKLIDALAAATRERDGWKDKADRFSDLGKQFERDARSHFDQSCQNVQRAEVAERERDDARAKLAAAEEEAKRDVAEFAESLEASIDDREVEFTASQVSAVRQTLAQIKEFCARPAEPGAERERDDARAKLAAAEGEAKRLRQALTKLTDAASPLYTEVRYGPARPRLGEIAEIREWADELEAIPGEKRTAVERSELAVTRFFLAALEAATLTAPAPAADTPGPEDAGGGVGEVKSKTVGDRCEWCCWGDRCDDPSHYYRPQCPYCQGTGTVLEGPRTVKPAKVEGEHAS
jgi:hypothetical protein